MSSDVLTLDERASAGRAYAEMKLARIRHFPVVNAAGDVVGIISRLDLGRALALEGFGKSRPLRELMSTKVQLVDETAPAHLAAKLMRDKKIGALPVVDAEGRLTGIITDTDFLVIAERALAGKRLLGPKPHR